MIKHLILTILIIAIFGNTSRAEQTNIYNKIEDIIIYNDYNMMKSVSREIEREILSVKSVESKIDLQQTLGLLNLHMGNLPKARKLFLKSLEMSIEHFPNDSKKIYSNAFFLLNSNDYLDFDQLDLVPSKILENLLTIHNSESAFFDAAKGCYIMSLNMFDMLEGVYESALEKASEDISNKIRWARLTYMMISDCMISAQMYQGNFEKALNLIEQSQNYIKENYTNLTYYYISAQIHKADILYQLGNYDKALDAVTFADMALQKRGVITGILNAKADLIYGNVYFDKKSYQNAAIFYKKARRIWTYDIYDKTSQLRALNREMECRFKNNDMEQGELLEKEIDDLIEKSSNFMEFINYMRITAERNISIGLTQLAIDLLENTICDTTSSIELDYDNALKIKNTLGYAYQTANDYDNAARVYSEIIRTEKQQAHDIFAFLPEGQRNLYWKKKAPVMDNIFKLNQEGTVTVTRGKVFMNNKGNKSVASKVLYDASLLNKGLLLEAFLNMQRTILQSGDKQLISAFEELRKLQGSDPARAEILEKTIMSKTAAYGDYMNFTKIGWEDVRNGLKENEAAIEFVVSENEGTKYYSAEVLRAHYDSPQHVFLFACSTEDRSLLDIGCYNSTGLYYKIWNKLKQHIEGCSDIYFAPAGDLYGVAIEYLPVNETQRMNDLYSMHRLSSTKSLATRNSKNGNGSNELAVKKAESAVLYGGLDYNLDSENMEFYAQLAKGEFRGATASKTALSRTWDLSQMKWGYLKGTDEEVRNISEILEKNSCNAKAITAGEGVEESFKALSGKSPQIIHVATHGFFIKESNDILKGTGLVFAGANNCNRQDSNTEDGLLTSHEISSMDLNGADLVVLSACQTALGEISGEGVFGLQRGFKKACAKTMLMSLWEVEDYATSQLMTSFYTNLAQGLDKTQALYKAQKHVMEVCGTDPSLWAGFIILD
ncbi:MAG: CHAT domain-containing protein [Bacteroidales bacterium]|nr:CHAT domain-containing protein [Bacteroidales bacterium]